MSPQSSNQPMPLSELADYQQGSIVSRVLMKAKSGNVTLFAFDAGQELSEHTAPFDAMVQVIDGQAQVTINAQPYTVRTGEMLIMPANQPHALRADIRFKMILTMLRE